ncbi:MAG: putative toxin-antitoxin system toxin component, PIN family [Gammaproteobacteria bacterium]|nr:putative toxin-antitoxin system toxin component, PIN family [Gammaproteobacteria bacterium]
MDDVRFVLDTNVVVAGIRSPTGASAALVEAALQREFVVVLSVALALEYEAACCAPDQRIDSGLSEAEVRVVITALCNVAEPVAPRFLWRPQLRDPADEMVLETAINGRADILVTFNRRDFGEAPLRFGIELLNPRDALRRVRK